jgi:hypothetical protein
MVKGECGREGREEGGYRMAVWVKSRECSVLFSDTSSQDEGKDGHVRVYWKSNISLTPSYDGVFWATSPTDPLVHLSTGSNKEPSFLLSLQQ